jgi:hypothetical protein
MRADQEAAKKREAVRNPLADEPLELDENDRSLAEILQDQRLHNLFVNHFLGSQGDQMAKDIVQVLADKTPTTQEQDKFLEKARKGFNQRLTEMERVRDALSDEEIGLIAHENPDVQLIVGKIGVEKAAQLLHWQLEELACSDGPAFRKITRAMRTVHDMRKSEGTQNLESRISSALERYGLTDQQYSEATASSMNMRRGVSTETRTRFRELAREQLGFFRSAWNFVSGGSVEKARARHLSRTFEEQRVLLRECDRHLKNVGELLVGTVHPDMKAALQRVMLEGGEIRTGPEQNGMASIAQFREARDTQHGWEAKRIERYRQFKAQEEERLKKEMKHSTGARGRWQQMNLTNAAYDGIRDRFADREYAAQQSAKGRGLLAQLFDWLFKKRPRADIRAQVATI